MLAVLAWAFSGLRHSADAQRLHLDQTLAPGPLAGWGNARVATLCESAALPPRLAWRWSAACEAADKREAGAPDTFPAALQADYGALQHAIATGVAQRQAQLQPLARSLGEGVLPEQDAQRVRDLTRELTAYRAHYRLGPDAATGSLLLACAWTQARSWGQAAATPQARATALANQLALVRGATAQLWWPAAEAEADWSAGANPECRALGRPREVLAQAADAARRVRDGATLANKSQAMERLLVRAPWLLCAWSLLTWALLSLARRTARPLRFLGPALIAWSAVGAVSAMALPASGAPVPAWIWAGMAGAGLGLAALGRSARIERRALFAPGAPLHSRSWFSLPLFALFVGLGWWLVIDLALNGHVQNRYIALRHSLAVFAAMLLLSVLPVLARGVASVVVAWAGLITNALRPGSGHRLGGWTRPLLLWLLYAVLVLTGAVLARGWRQLTGELLSLLLLVGVAWFFLLRASRWAGQGSWRELGMSMLPLVVHAGVVLVAFVLTDDLGPMLVALFASAIYAAAFVSQALLARGARWPLAGALGAVSALALTAALCAGLLAFTQLPGASAQRVAQRLDSAVNPYSAENDQLAHVLWLGQHTPASGWGLGAVPWCGTQAGSSCPGVPVQTQSDYSFAALRAVVGRGAAFALLGVYLLWIANVAVRQAARSPGALTQAATPAVAAAWLAWLGVCWAVFVLVQTTVTVAGNLGVLPLTGVTWPFVSYGLWSLLHHTLILGLVMHRTQAAT